MRESERDAKYSESRFSDTFLRRNPVVKLSHLGRIRSGDLDNFSAVLSITFFIYLSNVFVVVVSFVHLSDFKQSST